LASALLLIDVQNEVLHPKGTLRGDLPKVADGLLANIRRLVSWAREQSIPVIWVRMAFRPGYIDASKSVRAAAAEMAGRLVDGTWGAEIVDDVGRLPEDPVVTKKRPSAFLNTDLLFVLRGLGVHKLIVAGTSTNWAVEATVRDAESLDYDIVSVRDATGARMGDLHEPALKNMATRYAVLMSTDEVIGLQG
jgi:nicotinamidase-related amidase